MPVHVLVLVSVPALQAVAVQPENVPATHVGEAVQPPQPPTTQVGVTQAPLLHDWLSGAG